METRLSRLAQGSGLRPETKKVGEVIKSAVLDASSGALWGRAEGA